MATTPLQSIPYPDLDDPANGPDAFQDGFEYLEGRLVMRFASTAARDAAVTSPAEGMHAVTTDTDTLWWYSGSAWVAVASYTKLSYTPVLAAGGGSPSLGTTGTATGSYWYIGGGLIAYKATLLHGGTGISWGTGAITVTAPLAAAGTIAGRAHLLDNGVGWFCRDAQFATSTTIAFLSEAGAYVVSGTPFTPAASDSINLAGVYELA